ncbi:MAG TPA: M2 family metallopeptidase [Vicinamibacterales bacterium]|nr:M2 family metallopeptidase [Vicinamibacterales bacterium]
MNTIRRVSLMAALAAVTAAAACTRPTAISTDSKPDDALKFLADANETMKKLEIEANQAGWVQQNFITEDTEAIEARVNQRVTDAIARFAKDAVKYDKVTLPADQRRQLDLLKNALVMATPSDPKLGEELTTIMARLESTYGKGKWCPDATDAPAKPDACMNIDDITKVMADSRDEKKLRQVWEGWHTISPPMRKDYARFVELSNKGASELGFRDTGAMWRAKYDMPPDQFTKELDRLWDQVRPLYVKLHAYVRMKLHEKYGDAVPLDGPIPAHLLGNIWAQDWSNIYPLVAPKNADPGYDLTAILKQRNMPPLDMVRAGERFYSSLGFAPLPKTFWERSLFVRPKDREVVCHASAWDIDIESDVRIKMCIEQTAEDFTTIHHELGHNYYQRAYDTQPILFRDSANDGFHEAIGDTIALSVTPEYLVKIGLLGKAPDQSRDTGLLMKRALEKIAFLPFGLLIDQWRWKVFSGEVKPADYNKAWWDLRLKYQGVAPPSPRGEDLFDPGAKYHVPDNTPYTRYFLADILQFQFHRALSKTAGCTSPLHRCSIFESKEAGTKLNTMLSMGTSKPWPEELEVIAGTKQMDASAILDYFAPLDKWLDEQLKGQKIGW